MSKIEKKVKIRSWIEEKRGQWGETFGTEKRVGSFRERKIEKNDPWVTAEIWGEIKEKRVVTLKVKNYESGQNLNGWYFSFYLKYWI